jgi:hypothetical protein
MVLEQISRTVEMEDEDEDVDANLPGFAILPGQNAPFRGWRWTAFGVLENTAFSLAEETLAHNTSNNINFDCTVVSKKVVAHLSTSLQAPKTERKPNQPLAHHLWSDHILRKGEHLQDR